jgi:hypothetical protein
LWTLLGSKTRGSISLNFDFGENIMAKASRNERRKARIKRTNSLLKKQLRGLSVEAHKSYVMLMALLAQKGGEITVTKGTLQQAAQDILKLGYNVVADPTDDANLIVRLVVVEPTMEQSDVVDTELENAHASLDDDGSPTVVADPPSVPDGV